MSPDGDLLWLLFADRQKRWMKVQIVDSTISNDVARWVDSLGVLERIEFGIFQKLAERNDRVVWAWPEHRFAH